MTKINATIVADSICPRGHRITSFLLTYPRIIHSEVMTHRMFSRNAASSRAIPFKTMLKSIEENPFVPIAWQKDHSGMQGTEYLTDSLDILRAKHRWLIARDNAIEQSKVLHEGINVTKQLCNRLLEPFQWYTCLVTATEYDNFFDLRCPQYSIEEDLFFKSKQDFSSYYQEEHIDNYRDSLGWLKINQGKAEIHLMELAECMWDARNESKPKELKIGEWHIPFEDKIDEDSLAFLIQEDINNNGLFEEPFITNAKIKISTSMAARTSYTVVGNEKEFTYQNHIDLHDKIITSGHWSPFEHCGYVMTDKEYENNILVYYKNNKQVIEKGVSRNFRGFKQYRQIVDENYNV